MAASVPVRYSVIFGRLDASEWIDRLAQLTDEEETIYNEAVRLGKDLNEIAELRPALDRVYDEVEAEEISLALENEDEYAMECQGCIPLDPDEVNDMVADRDPHALEFFGLDDMSDDELDEWDANDEDMPTLDEFDPDFEPYSPFDEGWTLHIVFGDPERK